MDGLIITTTETAYCLTLLKAENEAITAAALAVRLGLSGNRETQRRHVRELIKHLRDSGSRIVATLSEGYFLTSDDSLWRDYLEGKQIDAKRIIGESARRKRVLVDSQGQGFLFAPNAVIGLYG